MNKSSAFPGLVTWLFGHCHLAASRKILWHAFLLFTLKEKSKKVHALPLGKGLKLTAIDKLPITEKGRWQKPPAASRTKRL